MRGGCSCPMYAMANWPACLSLNLKMKVPDSWSFKAAFTSSRPMKPYSILFEYLKKFCRTSYPVCHNDPICRWYLIFWTAFPNQSQNSSYSFCPMCVLLSARVSTIEFKIQTNKFAVEKVHVELGQNSSRSSQFLSCCSQEVILQSISKSSPCDFQL